MSDASVCYFRSRIIA